MSVRVHSSNLSGYVNLFNTGSTSIDESNWMNPLTLTN